jgi:hypothetical protein
VAAEGTILKKHSQRKKKINFCCFDENGQRFGNWPKIELEIKNVVRCYCVSSGTHGTVTSDLI